MHTFIDNIITFSLRNKFFIFFCTTIAVIAGITSFIHTPIDAFPDVTNTKVTIITQWPGRSAEEIEKFITIPIEIAMNPVQKKTDILRTGRVVRSGGTGGRNTCHCTGKHCDTDPSVYAGICRRCHDLCGRGGAHSGSQ